LWSVGPAANQQLRKRKNTLPMVVDYVTRHVLFR